jgi:hypothetical protein
MIRAMMRTGTPLAVVAAALALGACKSPRGFVPPYGQAPLPTASRPGPGEMVLDRGDWLLGDQSAVYRVLAQEREGPPTHVGYVVSRRYREVRGGPVFTMHEVTSLDRDDQLGLVDSLGRAKKFTPRIGGGIDVVELGANTLEASVGAIFGLVRPVTLERTTERRIAFEMLDANKDGGLSPQEWPRAHGREDADRNRDGVVDFAEFDAIDRL